MGIKMVKNLPDMDYLNECFDYINGDLIWKDRPLHHFQSEKSMKRNNTRQKGKKSGCDNGHGYLRLAINGKFYVNHRIVFKIFTGKEPSILDHIDGNKKNNRIENLREVSHSQNACNQKINITNILGVKGVSYVKSNKKFKASIFVNGKQYWGGYHPTLEEAKEVYAMMANKYHGDYANLGEVRHST